MSYYNREITTDPAQSRIITAEAGKVKAAAHLAALRRKKNADPEELRAAVAADQAAGATVKAERAKQAKNRQQVAMNSGNPFQMEEINWPMLGGWCADSFKGSACYVKGRGWGEWTGTHWTFSKDPGAAFLDKVRAKWAKDGGICQVVEKLNANARAAQYITEHTEGRLTVEAEKLGSGPINSV